MSYSCGATDPDRRKPLAQEASMLEWLSRRSRGAASTTAPRVADVHADALARATKESAPRIDSLVVPTANRPALLRRCLTGHLRAIEVADRSCELVVCDDSPDTTARDTESIARLRPPRGGVRYFGIAERRALAERLVAAGARPDLVEFALFGDRALGRSVGANRNAALLATAGRVSVCVDDDVVAHLAPIPGAAPGLALTNRGDPTEVWFHPEREAARAALDWTAVDPLALHELLLGRTFDDLVAAHAPAASDLDAGGVSAEGLRALASRPVVVRTTQLGLVGDSAMTWPAALLVADGATRRRLQTGFERHGLTREVVRGVQRLSIGRPRSLMAYHLGLDGRRLLPPFFPSFRNSDGVFAETLRRCDPGSCSGWIPWAVEHDPSQPRPLASGEVERAFARPRMSLLLLHAMAGWSPPASPTDPAERMRALGRHLARLRDLDPREFAAKLLSERRRQRIGVIERLQAGRRAATSSVVEQAYARAIVSAERGLLGPLAVVPVDLAPQADAAAAHALVQLAVARFGELLELWPDLWNGAATG